MRISTSAILISLSLCVLTNVQAQAQTIYIPVSNIALKNGESTELSDVYFISTNCKSLLTGPPQVEILDGPPGVAVEIKPAMVVPRGHSCANPVSGGKLVVRAKDVEDYSYSRMVIRITYKTRSGDRQRSHNINVQLFP